MDLYFDDDIATRHLFFCLLWANTDHKQPILTIQGMKVTLRCPPTFWLALSLKSRQTTHPHQALLLFTLLKCYDVKVVMLPYVIRKLYFFSTLHCLPSAYLLIHEQKKSFLTPIHHHISWGHHTGHITQNSY